MNHPTNLTDLAVIAETATQLGRALLHNSHLTDIRHKGDRDTVTNVDLAIEREIRAYLAKATPDIGFYSEEHDGATPLDITGPIWTLDPIDGTANYTHGLPLCAVSLALIHHGTPTVAVIDAPFLDLRYTATTGNGAHVNGHRIHVSTTADLADAIVAIGDYAVGPGAAEKNIRRLNLTATLAQHVERIRMFGTAALDLAWLAEGRIDAAIMLSNKPWDTAAGTLIAKEAGAHITDAQNNPHTPISTETISTTPGIAQPLHELIRTGTQ
jgi:myo-inositol-1(or 4)-monophosphatase